MQYKTHLVTSLVITAPLLYANHELTLANIGGLALGALLPDIDEESSYIGKRTFFISRFINKVFGHRGLTHWLITWLILSLILFALFHNWFVIALSIGYLLHLCEDRFSVSGLHWLMPFSDKRFAFPSSSVIVYRTGSLKELGFFFVMVVILFTEMHFMNDQLGPTSSVIYRKVEYMIVHSLVEILKFKHL